MDVIDNGVAHLPVKARRPEPRHVYREPVYVLQDPSRGREHPQTERTCAVCALVKITVHGPGGAGWREWRLPHCVGQFGDADGAPPCISTGAAP